MKTNRDKTQFEEACESDIDWMMESIRSRYRVKRTNESDGFFEPEKEEDNE